MDVVLLFPGQGSQKPGMGKDLAEEFPEARRVFEEVDEALGFSLSKLCFEGPAEELTLTHNAQPALLAHGAAAWSVVRNRIGSAVCAAAGHSLGEHTAYHAADATTLADAVRLVRRRGQLMYEEGLNRPGAMAAVLGKLEQTIESLCEQASRTSGVVVPANYNTEEQIVVSGEVSGVERVMALAKEAGAKRAVRLPVSGAFHSPLMKPAEDGLRQALASTPFAEPAFPVFSNVTEQESRSSADARELLATQLTSPVRWAGEITNIASRFRDPIFVELGPGAVLTGLLTRIVPGARGLACGTPAEVEKLMSKVA
ncbi:MAG TPA: ACP S-malonyltransferase [Gemmatimonadaceae bacterium]|nr:ACP S-malonyltransferase [Gemmatimonadaceae bacterium]